MYVLECITHVKYFSSPFSGTSIHIWPYLHSCKRLSLYLEDITFLVVFMKWTFHSCKRIAFQLLLDYLIKKNLFTMEEWNEAVDLIFDIEIHNLLGDAAEEDRHRPVARRPRYIVADRMDPFTSLTDEEYVDRFRLTKECVHHLIGEIRDQLPPANDRRGCPVPPSLQVLIAIRCMADGSHQISVGDAYNISQCKVSTSLKTVARAIANMSPQYIKFPAGNDLRQKMMDFQSIAGFPGVIGTIDCTHIPILKPSLPNSEIYRCRKGFFSLNVQAVAGPDLTFYNVVSRWQGSVHNSRIFANSRLCAELEEGLLPGHLLGDSGYPCRKYLLTPLPNPTGRSEEAYNISHSRTRNTVERAFGVLKRRFGYLGGRVRTNLETTKAIIVASMVLHNIAVRTRVIRVENEQMAVHEEPVFQEPALPLAGSETAQGRVKRQNIIRHYF
ncbi:putative nuclease HARBI1 isoform X2 [Macrobrachium rosenbergii]|uniref:putative nuclease HARBI1 isoform X2 n=1 Tax=Macrobrachium rosenbergii TaxID=79674 RepID=UPI0034D78DE0